MYAAGGVRYSCFFFFSSRRRHTRFSRDWSSDVCSSDLRSCLESQVRQHDILPRAAAIESRISPTGAIVAGLTGIENSIIVRARYQVARIIRIHGDRSEERRVGKSVDRGERRLIRKKDTD